MSNSLQSQYNFLTQSSVSKNKVQQAYVPFIYKSKRNFPDIQHQETPPVGTYQINSCFDRKIPQKLLESHNINGDYLQQFHQNSIFKSNVHRFKTNYQDQNVGPAYYNIQTQIDQKSPNQKSSRQKILISNKTSPSIPHRLIKFGYCKDNNGKLTVVEKTIQQLQRQKIKLKNYSKTLFNQKKYTRNRCSIDNWQLKKQSKIQAMMEKAKSYLKNSNTSHIQSNKQSTKKIKFKKIDLKKSEKIQKIIMPIGPGYYKVNLNTLKSSKMNQKYQFFGSSSLRFKQFQTSNYSNQDQYYSTLSCKSSNLEKNKKYQLYHKTQKKVIKDPIQYPGPGQYNSNDNLIKKSVKVHSISKQNRFPPLNKQIDTKDCWNCGNKQIEVKASKLLQKELNIFKNNKIAHRI